VADLTLPVATAVPSHVAVTALSSALRLRTLGTRATAALPRAKMPAKTVHVKLAVGKSAAVTTATPPAPPRAALPVPVTSLHAAPSLLVPATSSPTPLQAKALPSAAARAC